MNSKKGWRAGVTLSTKFIRFGGVGILNTAIHTVVAILAVETLSVWPPVGQALGFITSNLFSYIVNALVTFRMPVSLAGYVKFLSISLTTLLVALALSTTVQMLGLNYLIGLALFVLLNPLISFTMHCLVTFRKA